MTTKWFCCPYPGCRGTYKYKQGSTQHLLKNDSHLQYIVERAHLFSMDMLLVDNRENARALLQHLLPIQHPVTTTQVNCSATSAPAGCIDGSPPISHSSSIGDIQHCDNSSSGIDHMEDDHSHHSSSDHPHTKTSDIDMSVAADNEIPAIQVNKTPVGNVACQRDYVVNWLDEIYKNHEALKLPEE
jgi:hypothetical protein